MSLTVSGNSYALDRFDESIIQGRAEKMFAHCVVFCKSAKNEGKHNEVIALPLGSEYPSAYQNEKDMIYDEKVKEIVIEKLEEVGYKLVPMHYERDEHDKPIGVYYMISW